MVNIYMKGNIEQQTLQLDKGIKKFAILNGFIVSKISIRKLQTKTAPNT